MLHLYREYLIDTKKINTKKDTTTNIVYKINMHDCNLQILAKFGTLKLAKSYIDYIIQHQEVPVTDTDYEFAKTISNIINLRIGNYNTYVDIKRKEDEIELIMHPSGTHIPIMTYITQAITHQTTKEYIINHLIKLYNIYNRNS